MLRASSTREDQRTLCTIPTKKTLTLIGNALSETKLLEHGFHGGRSLQHPMKNNPELFEYIQKHFK